MTVCFVAHSHRLSTQSLSLESVRNRTPSNLNLHHTNKIHRKKCWQEDAPLWPTGPCALVHLSTMLNLVLYIYIYTNRQGTRLLLFIKKSALYFLFCKLIKSQPYIDTSANIRGRGAGVI